MGSGRKVLIEIKSVQNTIKTTTAAYVNETFNDDFFCFHDAFCLFLLLDLALTMLQFFLEERRRREGATFYRHQIKAGEDKILRGSKTRRM
jgi:hypothetical protein